VREPEPSIHCTTFGGRRIQTACEWTTRVVMVSEDEAALARAVRLRFCTFFHGLVMRGLELKVPSVAVALLFAVAMWGATRVAPSIELPFVVRAITAIVLALIGTGISIMGILSLRRVKTTVYPTRPGSTSALVTSLDPDCHARRTRSNVLMQLHGGA
jgi:hypothetical protein